MKPDRGFEHTGYSVDEFRLACQQAHEGNPARILSLYQLVAYDRICRMYQRELPDGITSMDIAHEVAIKLARQRNLHFVSEENFIDYCYKVAHNILRDKYRIEYRHQRHHGPSLDDGEDRIASPMQTQLVDTYDALLDHLKRSLSPYQWEAIRLNLLGRNTRESASALGIKIGAYRGLLFRARQNAQDIFRGLNRNS